MAFVNEELTAEQREEFRNRGIANPASITGNILAPLFWTIDHDNDMCLVRAGEQRDYYNERYFVFLWKGETHIISLVKEINASSLVWKKEIQASRYEFSVDDPFVNDLKEALRTYKVFGKPAEMSENTEVFFKF